MVAWQTNCYQHAWKQNLDGEKNNPKISCASITNLHLTLAWAEENFPILRDLLGPIEPVTSIFFRNCRQCFIIQVLTLTQVLSTNQHGTEWLLVQNVATNLHSVKCETSIKYMLILTQNCALVWISLTFKLDKEAFKFSKVRSDNF